MDQYEKSIGKHIRVVRKERNLSQETLAEMCGFSNTTLSSYENSRKIPSLGTIVKIAKKLNVSIERLYYGDEDSSFIYSEPDEGKRIVNAVYYLWKTKVIDYYEDFFTGGTPFSYAQGENTRSGIFLELLKFHTPVKRLITSLREFQNNKKTYPDPEKYLEMMLSSVATQINEEIRKEKEEMKARQAKREANKKRPRENY